MSSNQQQQSSGSNAGSNTGSGSGSQQTSSSLSIPQSAPAGGITITQPPQTATSYFKLASNNPVTFAWNFTYVLVTPTHLTVHAVGENGNTYPVGPTDGIIPGSATSVVWDPWAYNQMPGVTPLTGGTYTLNVWDDRGPGSAREPGYMAPNSALQFALYTPQSYTPLTSGWTCVGCSGSLSSYTAHPAFAALMTTLVIMFLSGYSLVRQALH
ncbi:hypothetical protein OE88DRAFT_1665697 [Heliocybe sulcata]|uniref:DUF7137 domain-containing protein n=1 Tax=Heliocybe sulcata TaxID=5364 RepID=A0A5C3MQ42_9AGAM|nr:hypothetical protein OE88DRAFT_1665697 [Heliocybe sulcata]